MTDEQAQPTGYGAPPTHRSESPAPQPSWPVVIGVIMIVFGSFAALGGVYGALSPLMIDLFSGMVPENEQAFEAIKDWTVWIVAGSLVLSAIALVQLVAGIGLVRRRPWSPRLSVLWASAKTLWILVSVAPNYLMQQVQLRATLEDDSAPAGMETVIQTMMIVGTVLGLLWSLALPVFIFIWFSRANVKATVATWRAESGRSYEQYR